MFANPTQVGILQRVVATLVACAVVLWSVGAYATAQAASLVDVSNTLSDSDLSVTSAHLFEFEVPTGSTVAAGNDYVITDLDAGFTGMGALVSGNLTVQINGGAAETIGTFSAGANSVTFDIGNPATAGDVVTVAIVDGVITNPGAAGSYEWEITTENGDSGKTRVAIIDNVLVTAVVETVFDFTITGLATSTAINGTTTTGSTSPTEVAFGVLTAGVVETLAQQLNVTTNARSGFVVTLETDGDLASANGAIIDVFDEASDVSDTGTAWNSPVPDVGDETTWGHWGVTSTDGDLNSLGGFYSGEFGANDYIAASTTPREVFHHDGPSDGTTADIGQAEVGFQVEITALQEAADDYNTTVTYIATPTF